MKFCARPPAHSTQLRLSCGTSARLTTNATANSLRCVPVREPSDRAVQTRQEEAQKEAQPQPFPPAQHMPCELHFLCGRGGPVHMKSPFGGQTVSQLGELPADLTPRTCSMHRAVVTLQIISGRWAGGGGGAGGGNTWLFLIETWLFHPLSPGCLLLLTQQ